MFRSLPAARFEPGDLEELGRRMVSNRRRVNEGEDDPEESTIPAGYTYLGQFIAHDLTFDPVSSLQRANDPEALVNFRTPRFDLDCMYGRGPADQPYLYENDGVRLLVGELLDDNKSRDVPRVSETERAILGDPRNDENVIIAQLHALFLRFHNQLARQRPRLDFEAIQQLARWHYQWVVLRDFLWSIVSEETYFAVLPHLRRKEIITQRPPALSFYKARDNAFIPIEFSAAAFRFGHSMVRRRYRLNTHRDKGLSGPFELFGADGAFDLRGFRRFHRGWAIDWGLFFEGLETPPGFRVQHANKINTSLAKTLKRLPESLKQRKADNDFSLAQRNLIRGNQLSLPSGQSVSRAMGIAPLSDDELTVGTRRGQPFRLCDISRRFEDNAPLWYYVLAEAERKCDGNRLGPVGGRIVMETFVGLMIEDGHSFLRQNPLFQPMTIGGKFGMAEFIQFALGTPADGPVNDEAPEPRHPVSAHAAAGR